VLPIARESFHGIAVATILACMVFPWRRNVRFTDSPGWICAKCCAPDDVRSDRPSMCVITSPRRRMFAPGLRESIDVTTGGERKTKMRSRGSAAASSVQSHRMVRIPRYPANVELIVVLPAVSCEETLPGTSVAMTTADKPSSAARLLMYAFIAPSRLT
jgi:hypothetical protein